jgi:hypothetical protein
LTGRFSPAISRGYWAMQKEQHSVRQAYRDRTYQVFGDEKTRKNLKKQVNIKIGRTLESLEKERASRFLKLSPVNKIKELCSLIELSIHLGGKNRYKSPQERGIVIRKTEVNQSKRSGHF